MYAAHYIVSGIQFIAHCAFFPSGVLNNVKAYIFGCSPNGDSKEYDSMSNTLVD